MLRLLLATNNKGKVTEYRSLLSGLPVDLVTPQDAGIAMEVAETGKTYEENAGLKALSLAKLSGLVTLADDSGLEVDALGGEPGIRSSRYAGEGVSDSERINFLLGKLVGVPLNKRTARFRCIIAVALPDGRIEYSRGECHGVITLAPVGKNGFGYDPVFYFPELKKTMAELPDEVKNRISHRARAAEGVPNALNKLGIEI
jgi:XTP/dITP diphosphohydrolase